MIKSKLFIFYKISACSLFVSKIIFWHFNFFRFPEWLVSCNNVPFWNRKLLGTVKNIEQKYSKKIVQKYKNQHSAKISRKYQPENGYNLHHAPKFIVKKSVLIEKLWCESLRGYIFWICPLRFFKSLKIVKPRLKAKACAKEKGNDNPKVMPMDKGHTCDKHCKKSCNYIRNQGNWVQDLYVNFEFLRIHFMSSIWVKYSTSERALKAQYTSRILSK